MVRGSAEILATPPYYGLPSDWDALKAFSDGFTPVGTFRSPYTYLIDQNTDGGTTYYGACNAYQTIYGGFSAANHHIGTVDGADFDAVLAAALTALGDKGKIHLKSGIYPINGINITNSGAVTDSTQQMIEIEGEGLGNTILRGNTTSAGASSTDGGFTDKAWMMIDSNGTSGIRVYLHDFQIDGVHDSNANIVSGLILRYGRDALIDRVFVRRASRNGINLVGPNLAFRGVTVQDCQVFDINDQDGVPGTPAITHCSGINTTGGAADIFIKNNFIGWIGYVDDMTDSLGNGISLSDSCIAEGNVIWAAKNGIQTYAGTKDHVITNNFIDFTYTTGIFLDQSDMATVHNNTIRFPYGYGIYISDADKNSIQNNKFILRATYSSLCFINEIGTSDYNSVLSNNCEHNGTVTWITINPCGDHSIFRNNQGHQPLGGIGTPFKAANTSISWIGNLATPTASTDYTVMHSDCIITSTNSGNANNAILIKNPAGATINPTPLSTLDGYYLPAKYKINWGAFTGAAPTVNIGFI